MPHVDIAPTRLILTWKKQGASVRPFEIRVRSVPDRGAGGSTFAMGEMHVSAPSAPFVRGHPRYGDVEPFWGRS